ncbi:MAG: hypothetical protein KatS3mg111_3783 [Pirellulaceae bacterium]|nr:MAG: hypothetical protein KatS3mg111_3783 [Pirellulaceae bacterium]
MYKRFHHDNGGSPALAEDRDQQSSHGKFTAYSEEVSSPGFGDPYPYVSQLNEHATKLIKRHPVTALSAAVVAGIVLGWWVKRR